MERQTSRTDRIAHPPITYRICDLPSRLRPREAAKRLGLDNVSDDVLIALLLRTGTTGINVVDLANELLVRHGSLSNLAAASVSELAAIKGIGEIKAQIVLAALQLARRLSEECLPGNFAIRSPADILQVMKELVRPLEKEVFWILMLDTKNQLKSNPIAITEGLLNASLVHAREVFSPAIKAASAAILLCHNHPSGDPTPSTHDIRVTKQLIEAGRIIDIPVLDHVIIGRPSVSDPKSYVSMNESGLVKFK